MCTSMMHKCLVGLQEVENCMMERKKAREEGGGGRKRTFQFSQLFVTHTHTHSCTIMCQIDRLGDSTGK